MAIEFSGGTIVNSAPQPASTAGRSWRHFGQKVGSGDRIAFTERLSLQLTTGVTLHTALQSLLLQTENPAMKAIINDLSDTIVQGGTFSQALAKHPELFSSAYVNLVAASETGGFLADVLEQLLLMDEKQERLRSAIVSALSYPAFLAFFSVAVVVFVLVVVFPKFTDMFATLYADLPITTKVLMGISDQLLQRPVMIAAMVAALAAAIVLFAKSPQGAYWLDRMKLHTPVVKDIYIRVYISRLMRIMGISIQRGVTVRATLTACREVIPNAEMRRFIAHLENQVTEGKGIALGFKDSDLIPAEVTQMITTGEETGRLGHVMQRIADFYERELTKQLERISKLAEPVMLLVMGAVVGVIVSSLILPIFKMSKAIH